MKKRKTKLSPVARAIASKLNSIARSRAEQAAIMENARARCIKIGKNIVRQQFLIDGLRSGKIKP